MFLFFVVSIHGSLVCRFLFIFLFYVNFHSCSVFLIYVNFHSSSCSMSISIPDPVLCQFPFLFLFYVNFYSCSCSMSVPVPLLRVALMPAGRRKVRRMSALHYPQRGGTKRPLTVHRDPALLRGVRGRSILPRPGRAHCTQ